MHIKVKIKAILSLILVSIVFSSCTHDRKKPGLQYMDDMVTPIAYEDYSPNPVFANGQTEQMPVAGTIARGKMPYPYARTADGQKLAGEQLQNPYKASKEILVRGKAKFDIYCMICHGSSGRGDGTLFTSGKFSAPPTDLMGERVQNLPDGEIYHVITKGSIAGLMGAHGSQIKSDDRWKIVTYIKNGCSTKVK
jgi:mono/diheme cytochrome c family protein